VQEPVEVMRASDGWHVRVGDRDVRPRQYDEKYKAVTAGRADALRLGVSLVVHDERTEGGHLDDAD
jgi:hypothetical protein